MSLKESEALNNSDQKKLSEEEQYLSEDFADFCEILADEEMSDEVRNKLINKVSRLASFRNQIRELLGINR